MSTVSSEYDDDDDGGQRAELTELAYDQVWRARRQLKYDASKVRRLRFRPQSLHAIARYMAPGQLIIAAAATGIGKTTFGLSTADDFLLDGARVAYMGLEMEDIELRTAFACLRAQVPRWMAVENSWAEHADGKEMFDRVQNQLSAQQFAPLVEQLLFLPQRYLDAKSLREAARQAGKFKADVLVVDHINHGKQGDFGAFVELVQLSKKVAEDEGFVNLTLAQMNRDAVRGGHKLTRYQPMQLHHIQGGGAIEQNAVIVLNPYRPILPATSESMKALIKKAMAGDIEPTSVLERDRMGIAVLKHRTRGELEGHRCVLRLDHGKLLDL